MELELEDIQIDETPPSGESTENSTYTVESIYVPDDRKKTTLTISLPPDYIPDPLWATLHPDAAAIILDAMTRVITIAAASANAASHIHTTENKERENKAYARGHADATRTSTQIIEHMKTQNTKLEDQNNQLATKILATIEKAFGKTATPKDKGDAGESMVEAWITERFPDAILTQISTTPHSMDLILRFQNGITVLIEVKNKDRLDKKDVDKFESDAKTNTHNANAAILLSLRTNTIPMRGHFQMANIGKMAVVYMANELSLGGKGLAIVLNMLRTMRSNDLTETNMQMMNDLATQALHSQKQIHAQMTTMKKLTKSLQDAQNACAEPLAELATTLGTMVTNAVQQKHGNKGRRKNEEKE